ncbi:Hypothetical protein (Fragment), partial [Durusdinium trenchii]
PAFNDSTSMKKCPAFNKWKEGEARQLLAQKLMQFLSPESQDSLARDLKESPEKPRFDHALNTLLRSGGDQVTRQNLLEAIRKELPALPLQQAEQHLRRSFRHKVNSLRCLGQKVLLTLLQVQFVSENPSKRRRRDLPGNAEEMVV